jgi:hypothetical protein
MERFWKDGDSLSYVTYDYLYHPSGELFRFNYRRDGYDLRTESRSPFEWFKEVFDRDGALVGCALGSGGGSAKGLSVGYWLGKEVGIREFMDHLLDAQAKAYR